ncbi:MAG: hypothetical protein LLG04_19110 [Parachlamydia sp.]|nr:hypothetical protein [Parachlamydia sp.]
MDEWHKNQFWDEICITSMFTYDFNELIKTTRYYSQNLFNYKNIKVGGVSATLMSDEVEALTGIKPHAGTINTADSFLREIAAKEIWASYLRSDHFEPSIDMLPPDYDIFGKNSSYAKILNESYILYTTKGCVNKCSFCAVHILEPDFVQYIPIRPRVEYIATKFGERRGLLLLDNNVTASDQFNRIIDEIKDMGFKSGDKLNNVMKFVDFNQGVDARRLNKSKMKKLSEIAIKPLRIAFDDIKMERLYRNKMILAIDCGIKYLSNYILYNYNDPPEDLYNRMKITIDINQEHDAKIFSFPMKFVPLTAKDRTFIGYHWTKRQLRAIRLILNVTKGIVSHKKDFFEHAFGRDEEEYRRILLMPQDYILNRVMHEKDNSIADWNQAYSKLSDHQKKQFANLISADRLRVIPTSKSKKMNSLLSHYECELTENDKVGNSGKPTEKKNL